MEGVVVGYGSGEAAIDNHLHLLPHHLYKISATVVTATLQLYMW